MIYMDEAVACIHKNEWSRNVRMIAPNYYEESVQDSNTLFIRGKFLVSSYF